MDPVTAVRTCLTKYATFEGRARRSEFWWFYLFLSLVALVLSLPGSLVMMAGLPWGGGTHLRPAFWIGLVLVLLGTVLILGLLVPYLAVGARRLHDTGQSAWFLLLLLVPVGSLVLLVFWILEGNPGENAYGPPPA